MEVGNIFQAFGDNLYEDVYMIGAVKCVKTILSS